MELTPGKPRRSIEHGILLAGALLGPVLLVVFAVLVPPDPRGYGTHEKLGLPPCVMMQWFHIPCPGCGVTTSVALAARGRLFESGKNQPFGLLVALAIPIVAGWAVIGHLRGRDLFRDLTSIRLGPWIAWGAGIVGVAWIYKIAIVVASRA